MRQAPAEQARAVILEIQNCLRLMGYNSGPMSGEMGAETQRALQQWAHKAKLPPNAADDTVFFQFFRECEHAEQAPQRAARQAALLHLQQQNRIVRLPMTPLGGDLAAARVQFTPTLLRQGPAPQAYQPVSPPAGVQQVKYPSGRLWLKAWISEAPTEGTRHPAVVFLHGGHYFGGSLDWDEAAAFVEAGFVMLIPMLRGENGNPGHFEAYYSEVDDIIAAGHFVRALPYVDPNHVFLAGHSVGAILTVLTAMMPSPYKAGAALDGYLDIETYGYYRAQWPFDRKQPEEIRLRNPMAFIPSVRIPLVLFATHGIMREMNERFVLQAQQLGKHCELITVPGSHGEMARPAVELAIPWFRRHITQ